MGNKIFLVTGAKGEAGAFVVPMLIEMGYAVPAFTHTSDERSAGLRAAGAEIVVGDLLELAAIVEGIGRQPATAVYDFIAQPSDICCCRLTKLPVGVGPSLAQVFGPSFAQVFGPSFAQVSR